MAEAIAADLATRLVCKLVSLLRNEVIQVWKLDEDVMEGLQPHPNLKGLKVEDFMGKKFSSWITMMTNLVKITFSNCNRCEVLPPLGHLPKLREIKIRKMENV
ncbi:hypothetical protein POM88_039984 [Heracleum sosnowskyi]|uniref:R13L1/DRL21-like LRR repeat region domain-containing protein n=1 Tax=Heracleum sosnowskyi TaxID=360622 RepID=A0AAD8HDW2_9APIA|nr:hypothetical protein POM88_039984 [Heracleum sosnowskyi]